MTKEQFLFIINHVHADEFDFLKWEERDVYTADLGVVGKCLVVDRVHHFRIGGDILFTLIYNTTQKVWTYHYANYCGIGSTLRTAINSVDEQINTGVIAQQKQMAVFMA